MSFFCIIDMLQSLKKAYSMRRDILHMSMNTHITMYA